MKIFTSLYERSLVWSEHRLANLWLGIVSFTESCIFIIPPDIMLAPMTLAKPKEWLKFAGITTITSLLGGSVGYLLGYWLMRDILPLLDTWGQMEKYEQAKTWFTAYGIVSLLVASFTPIPYKIFAIVTGALSMNFPLFVVFSFIGRGSRYGLIAWLVKQYGQKIINHVHRYLEHIGWGFVVLVALYFGIRFLL